MSRLRVAKIGCQPWIRIGVAKDVRMHAEPGGGADVAAKREIVVYWYSFSNHHTVCIHYGFSLVGNNLNNTLRTP